MLRSWRLAVGLLIAVAAQATLSTLVPHQGAGLIFSRVPGLLAVARALGLVDIHRSPCFLAIVALLCLNLLACTWHRAVPLWRKGRTSLDGSRRRHLLLDAAMHLSLLAIVGGGVGRGIWGSVRTQNVHVGRSADAFYDFALDRDVPLGFTVEVLERRDTWYPLHARIGISDQATGTKITLLDVVEGRRTEAPGAGLSLRLSEVKDGGKTLLLIVSDRHGRSGEVELETAGGGRTSADFADARLTLVAWKREIKAVRGRIACAGGGLPRTVGWVSPQERVMCGGTSFAMTAWGTDPEGGDFVGLQAVRDPAAPLFWGGCVAFCFFLLPLIGSKTFRPAPGMAG